MSNEIVKHHGFDFILDTMDWTDRATADKAGRYLEDALRELDEPQTRALHNAMRRSQDGQGTDEDNERINEWSDIGNRCALRAMEEDNWVSIPDTGHNCDLAAT